MSRLPANPTAFPREPTSSVTSTTVTTVLIWARGRGKSVGTGGALGTAPELGRSSPLASWVGLGSGADPSLHAASRATPVASAAPVSIASTGGVSTRCRRGTSRSRDWCRSTPTTIATAIETTKKTMLAKRYLSPQNAEASSRRIVASVRRADGKEVTPAREHRAAQSAGDLVWNVLDSVLL